MPDIDGLIAPQFSSAWWAWWKAMQPAWRSKTLSQDLRSTGDFDWSATYKGSQNGLFGVLLALGWWVLGVQNGSGAGAEGYAGAISDVSWVIVQMIGWDVASPSLGKRPRGQTDASRMDPKK